MHYLCILCIYSDQENNHNKNRVFRNTGLQLYSNGSHDVLENGKNPDTPGFSSDRKSRENVIFINAYFRIELINH